MKKLLIYFLTLITFMVNMPAIVLAQMSPQADDGMASANLKQGFQTYEKGLWSNTADLARQDGYAAVLDNLHTNKDGVWTDKGHGWELQNESAFNSGAQFVEGANISTRHRGEAVLFQVGDKVYYYDGTTPTDVTGDSVPQIGHIPCIRSFQNTGGNYYMFCNDVEEPTWGYDGGSGLFKPPVLGHLPGSPGHETDTDGTQSGFPVILGGKTYSKPPYCEGYYGRVVYAGFADHPHTLLISSPFDGNIFQELDPPSATDAGAIEIPPQLGDITGLCPLRVGNGSNDQTLIVGCSHGVAILTGSDSTNFATKELTRAYGVPNNRTWVPLGDNLIFCATDGIRRIANSAYGANVVGTPVSYPIQDLYQRLNTAASDQMWAINNRATQELEFWLPIDSNTESKNVLVANYRTTTGQDLVWSTMSSVSGACGVYIDATSVPGTSYRGLWVGGYDGYLQNWWGGYDPGSGIVGPVDYGGAVIPWKFVSGIIGANSFAQSSSMRKFIIICDGGRQQFYCTGYVYVTNSDGTTRRLQLDRKYIGNYDNNVGDPTTTWDEGLVGGTHLHPALFDYSPRGSGRLWYLMLTGGQSYSAFAGDTIDLVGIQTIQQTGGLKQ